MTAIPRVKDAIDLPTVFEQAAIAAGQAIMEIYAGDDVHRLKADNSPVTIADERAEAIICRRLEEAFPHIPIVAEERAARGILPDVLGDAFFLVDPLDGTREFIRRSSDFTVNIALVTRGTPTHGVVLTPVNGKLYLASPEAGAIVTDIDMATGVRKTPPLRLETRKPQSPAVAVASKSHRTPETDAYLAENGIRQWVSVGSSLKFCCLASRQADIYPRFGRTMEWDTAAGDAVLRAAGGMTVTTDGRPLAYGKRNQAHDSDFANPSFIAMGRAR